VFHVASLPGLSDTTLAAGFARVFRQANILSTLHEFAADARRVDGSGLTACDRSFAKDARH
jgi:hypothetical protein